MKRLNVRIIGTKEGNNSQFKGPENIIIEENFLNLRKEIAINIQETYITPNQLSQKRKSSCHIIIKILNVQNKERILKPSRERAK